MSLRNPVKYPVKYYSWQDAQAPQLSNADGVIKTILKACLVTGYGSKAGAGWASLFEDAYRIVLRRPLRTGNPPDIKIENGTITGTTVRHRIVAQDNPTGLDDATELSAVNILTRSAKTGQEWHCFVTEFAVLFCYQIGNANVAGSQNILYFGSVQKLKDDALDYFITINNGSVSTTGTTTNATNYFTGSYYPYDFRRKLSYSTIQTLALAIAETEINNDYFAQPILYNIDFNVPFYCTMSSNLTDPTTKQVSISNRSMLRFMVYNGSSSTLRALYIPLDYWEL